MNLLWFHAFSAQHRGGGQLTLAQVVEILRYGPQVPPAVGSTQGHEEALGIEPSVYLYLGRSDPAFGNYGLAVEPSACPAGEMSPFDTGGLIKHIHPVCDCAAETKQEYVRAFTFSTKQFADRVAEYPGSKTADIERYVAGAPPAVDGPHEIWPGPSQAVWSADSGNQWQAWCWEGRWAAKLACTRVAGWTCAPLHYDQLLVVLFSAGVDDQFMKSYVPGGVGALVGKLR